MGTARQNAETVDIIIASHNLRGEKKMGDFIEVPKNTNWSIVTEETLGFPRTTWEEGRVDIQLFFVIVTEMLFLLPY